MTSAAWHFAGLATLPVLVAILGRLFPYRKVDSLCMFCGHTRRFDTPEEAREYARSHVSKCEAHPMFAALKRIEELEDAR